MSSLLSATTATLVALSSISFRSLSCTTAFVLTPVTKRLPFSPHPRYVSSFSRSSFDHPVVVVSIKKKSVARKMSSSEREPVLMSSNMDDGNPTTDESSSATASISTSTQAFPISSKIQETLDPCVILMKSLISQYAHLWTNRGGIYSLAQGVVYWAPPTTAYTAINSAMAQDGNAALRTYCPDEGLDDFREQLKTKLELENGLPNVNVMVTSGANQAYMNCVLTLLGDAGGKAVVFAPYYFNHVMAIQMTRGQDALVVGQCDEEGIPDLSWLEQALHEQQQQQQSGETKNRIDLVTIVNPGNPTGVCLPRKVVQQAVDICHKYSVWLVLDSTYEHFDHSTERSEAAFPCFTDPHVIHIFSFSKGYAMAGFRIGYISVSAETEASRDAFEQMKKVQDTIPICPARISQVAAMGALESGRGWVAEKVKTLDVGRAAILKAMAPLSHIMGGTGAMYVMGKLPDRMRNKDQEAARILVEDHGVAVIPGSFCGFPGWLRVCYSNLPPEQCLIAAERLEGGIQDLLASAELLTEEN